MMDRVRCLIINGPDRGVVMELAYYRPEIRVAARQSLRPVSILSVPEMWESIVQGLPERTYKCCFHAVDREMALYSLEGRSEEILESGGRDWIMPSITNGKRTFFMKGQPIVWIEPGRVIVDWEREAGAKANP